MSISDLNSACFRAFDNDSALDSVLNSSEYDTPVQNANLPMSVMSEFPAIPRPVETAFDLPSVFSEISARPSNSSSSNNNRMSVEGPPHASSPKSAVVLESFTDKDGKWIQPVVDLSLSVSLKVSDFKKWISRAWNVRESDVRKPKACSGGRVWVAEVESLNRKITIRKYKKDSEEYWKVSQIGTINGEALPVMDTSKRRKIDEVYDIKEEGYEMVYPQSSLSSLAEAPLRNLKKVSENRFTPKYEIIAFVKYCISQIKKDHLEQVFIETVSAANCFRPRFRPYDGERPDRPRSEYVDYSDPDAIVTEENRVLDCISWSYRLALQRYHQYFVEFIGDSDLQRRVMKCKHDDVPNNLNPLTSIDIDAMKEVKLRTQSFSPEKRQRFIDHAVENMEFHLTVGLVNKDHIVQSDDI